MTERLSVPAWGTPPRTVEDWSVALGEGCEVERDPDGTAWIVLEEVGLRGFAILEGPAVSAIDFDLEGPDPGPALARLEEAAGRLGWEIHEEEAEAED